MGGNEDTAREEKRATRGGRVCGWREMELRRAWSQATRRSGPGDGREGSRSSERTGLPVAEQGHASSL